MSTLLRDEHEEACSFIRDHTHLIEYTRKEIEKAIRALKFQSRIIDGFDLNADEVLWRKEKLKKHISFRLAPEYATFFSRKRIDVYFFVSFAKGGEKTQAVFNRKKGSLSVDMAHSFLAENIVSVIEAVIKKHAFGFKMEQRFWREFLGPFSKHHLSEIEYAYPTGDHKDYQEGIDFIVGYKPKHLTHTIEVGFNLKTSQRYLEEHKKRHPKVSAFSIWEGILDHPSQLASQFTLFLKKHLSEKVVVS